MNPHWSIAGKAAATSARKHKRILHVDDQQDWLDMVSTTLEDAGYVVLSAKDATQAMMLTEGVALDLIILDLDLNGENGLELMNYFRRNQPEVPIILLTGLSHDDDAILAMMQQGAHQYLRKGPLADLSKAVEAAVAR